MYKAFLKIVDWLEKFFKRFKVLGYIVVIGFLVFYFIQNGYEQKEAIRFAEKMTGLNLEKDLAVLEKNKIKSERDSLIEENYYLKESRDSILKEKVISDNMVRKEERAKILALNELKKISSDNSYKFIQKYFPYIGNKSYGFNSYQVSGIHKVIIENESNIKIIESKDIQLDICENALEASIDIEKLSNKILYNAEEEIILSDSIILIEEEKNDILMDDWEKKRRRKKWGKVWKTTEKVLYAVGGFFLGSAISK